MARFTVPGLLASALGDVMGAPVAGTAQGALAAPQIEAQYRNMGIQERQMGLHEQEAAQRSAMLPLKTRFMEAEIKRMERPEYFQTEFGTYGLKDNRLTEVPIPRPKIETTADGWTKITTPDGRITHSRPGLSPERHAQGTAELAKIGPQDIVGMMRWSSQYPELSGGLPKYMEYYQKQVAEQHKVAADQRLDARYRERTAMMGRRAGAAGQQPTIQTTEQPGGPVTNPAERSLAGKTFSELTGYWETPPGWLTKGKYIPGVMEQRYPGFTDASPNVWDSVVGVSVPKDAVIRYEMGKLGYTVTPRFNRATNQWDMLAVGLAPKTKEVRKTIGPSREAPSAMFGGGMPLGAQEED